MSCLVIRIVSVLRQPAKHIQLYCRKHEFSTISSSPQFLRSSFDRLNMIQSGWIVVNQVPTHIRTCGRWIEDPFETPPDKMIVLVTGNPGISIFYDEFIRTLHLETGLPVWTVAHAGGETPPSDLKMDHPSLKTHSDLYTVEGQLKHKLEFIQKYVPKSTKLILIGHSFGAKIIVQMMRNEDIAQRVEQTHLLFPTLEHINDTPMAAWYRYFLKPTYWFWILLTKLAVMLPRWMTLVFVRIVFALQLQFNISKEFVEGAVAIANPSSVRRIWFLASDEMKHIKELDNDVLEKNSSKIFTYYGQTDGWAPLEHYERLKTLHPNITCEVLPPQFKHSFIVNKSVEMGVKISNKMK